MATIGIVGAAGTATSTTSEVVGFAILLGFGVLGYFFAVNTRRVIGTTPWRLPPLVWAFLAALLPPWGLMLEWVARVTTRHAGPASPSSPTAAMRFPGATSVQPPATATPVNPAGGSVPWPERVDLRAGPDGWQPASPGDTSAGPPPLFGWYKDPDGRHELRYWDGRAWSDHVRDGSETSDDPLGKLAAPWQPEQGVEAHA